MAETAAFIGLGVMGYPMAGHLAAAGYEVRVYNRTQATAERWTSLQDKLVSLGELDAERRQSVGRIFLNPTWTEAPKAGASEEFLGSTSDSASSS